MEAVINRQAYEKSACELLRPVERINGQLKYSRLKSVRNRPTTSDADTIACLSISPESFDPEDRATVQYSGHRSVTVENKKLLDALFEKPHEHEKKMQCFHFFGEGSRSLKVLYRRETSEVPTGNIRDEFLRMIFRRACAIALDQFSGTALTNSRAFEW